MSKRRKPTIADRRYERTAKDVGSMAEETERLARSDDFDATLDPRAGEVDSTLEMLGLRERCRHVFQLGRGLTEALEETDLPGNMPAGALARLPEGPELSAPRGAACHSVLIGSAPRRRRTQRED